MDVISLNNFYSHYEKYAGNSNSTTRSDIAHVLSYWLHHNTQTPVLLHSTLKKLLCRKRLTKNCLIAVFKEKKIRF